MQNLKYKVLMVEDLKVAQKVAKLILGNDLGCAVDIAETGAQALELANKNNYDLIFMDLGLPDIDGLTVTETIRKSDTQPKVPIIALTAHGSEDYKSRCMEVGMNDFIVKPIKVEDGSRLINKYLVNRSQENL